MEQIRRISNDTSQYI